MRRLDGQGMTWCGDSMSLGGLFCREYYCSDDLYMLLAHASKAI